MTEPGHAATGMAVAKFWAVNLGQTPVGTEKSGHTVDRDADTPIKLRLEVMRSNLSRAHRIDSHTSWEHMFKMVGRISNLQYLTMSSFFSHSGRHALPLSTLTELLAETTNLQELQIDQLGLHVDGDLEAQFSSLQRACSGLTLLQRVTLSRMYFPRARVSRNLTGEEDTSWTSIGNLLKAFSSCPNLISFSSDATTRFFSRPDVAGDCALRVFSHPKLRSLSLEHMNLLLEESQETISTLLSQSHQLSSLRLTNCVFSGSIFSGFARNSSIKLLDLTDSNLIHEADALALSLVGNRCLEKIVLCNARLGASEIESHERLVQILQACHVHPTLKSLDLRGLYDYHYDDDITRPIELFVETLDAILALLKNSLILKKVFLDDLGDHALLVHPLAAVSFYQKLNGSGLRSTSSNLLAVDEWIKRLSLDRRELGYLFSVVRRNPMLCAEWDSAGNSSAAL